MQHRVRLLRRIGSQLRDPMILLLLAAVILTLSVGDLTDAAVIAIVIVVNTTVGVIQEVRADRAVTALAMAVSRRSPRRTSAAPVARFLRPAHVDVSGRGGCLMSHIQKASRSQVPRLARPRWS